ncbi:helix-turn-helix transcriptional regulator [Xenophilus aerolatus]|nr:AlpA family phage regulatory protein [Xenophilus aerolatus]
MQPNHTPNFDELPDSAFVRQAQLIPGLLPFSNATLWRMVKLGTFPKPFELGSNCTAWKVADVRAWIEKRTTAAEASAGAEGGLQRRPA